MGFSSEGIGHGCCFYFDIPVYNNKSGTPLDIIKSSENSGVITKKTTFSPRQSTSTSKIVPLTTDDLNLMESNEIYSQTELLYNPLNIMIVDDSEMNRKITRRILEREGLKEDSFLTNAVLFEADDGSTAVDLLEQRKNDVDFIFLDYYMQTMNGPEAAKVMRTKLGYKGKIIGVTGNSLESDISHFIDCGADSVLVKPMNSAKLIDQMFL